MGKKYELYKGKLNKSFEIVLMYNFIHVYFMKGLYEKTLKWTQEMLLNEDSQIRKDLMENARILHMILVFELKNEYQIRSYKRKFKLSVSVSKRLKDLPQRRIFNYLIEINKEKVRKNQMEKIKEVLALLERWKSDPKEINLPGYGELRLWLEAKLHKTTPGVVKIRIDREEPD